MTSLWRHSRLTYYDLGPNFLTQGVELLPGEVWQVSKRNSQYFRSYLRKTTGGPFGPPPSGARIRQVSIKFRITARQAGRDTSPPANGRPAAQDSGVWRHTTAERTVVCLVATRGLIRCPVGAIFRIPEILWFLYHYHSLRGILTQME